MGWCSRVTAACVLFGCSAQEVGAPGAETARQVASTTDADATTTSATERVGVSSASGTDATDPGSASGSSGFALGAPGGDAQAGEAEGLGGLGGPGGPEGPGGDAQVERAGDTAAPMMREVLGSVAAREVPQGTAPETAASFRRIPVTVNDRGPVGGIAGSGLHADRVSLGTQFSASRCRRPLERYSVSRGQDVSFCFRAVHRRVEESVRVHWLKDGRLVRRSTLPIPPIHAYRTRARLALRREYVGRLAGGGAERGRRGDRPGAIRR